MRIALCEQGSGEARRRCEIAAGVRGRGGVRGRFAPERLTIKLRYSPSIWKQAAPQNSIWNSILGIFSFSVKAVEACRDYGTCAIRCQFWVPLSYYLSCMIGILCLLPGGTLPNALHHSAGRGMRPNVQMRAAQGPHGHAGVWRMCGRGRAGVWQERTAQNSGRAFALDGAWGAKVGLDPPKTDAIFFLLGKIEIDERTVFSNSTRVSAQPPPVVMLRRLPASILLLSASFRKGFCNKCSLAVQLRRLLCCMAVVLADAAPWRADQHVAAQRTACVWQMSSRMSSRAALAHLSAPPATLAALGLGQLRTVACKRGRRTQFKV